jgi:death-on-curing protein
VKRKDPVWIDERDVLAIHDQLLAASGGRPGLRDEGLLQSALARPRQHHAYAHRSDVIEMVALYTAGIVRNHPFVDGNRRAGFVAGVLFLELNGFIFTASEEDATQAVFGLAGGTLNEAAHKAWLRANSKRGGNR